MGRVFHFGENQNFKITILLLQGFVASSNLLRQPYSISSVHIATKILRPAFRIFYPAIRLGRLSFAYIGYSLLDLLFFFVFETFSINDSLLAVFLIWQRSGFVFPAVSFPAASIVTGLSSSRLEAKL